MSEIGPLLAIRADATHRSGTGHVMRTLAIAQEWLRRDGRAAYLSTTLPPLLKKRLLDTGCQIIAIDPANDATSTVAAAETLKARVLLVDHYGLREDWWKTLPGERTWRTAALNDFARPIHAAADLRFSPTAVPLSDEFSGPAFVLIRTELRREGFPPEPPERAKHLLLLLGGADPLNAAPAVAKELLHTDPSLRVRVIVGPAATNLPELQSLAEQRNQLEVVHAPENMLPHLQWADTAVVSPSTTVFEMLHHGLVTGFVVSADNQAELAEALMKEGCARKLADVRSTTAHLDPQALHELLSSGTLREELASRGANLVDGLGAARICDELGLPEISFRTANEEDAATVWEWANDPATRAASFSPNEIPWEKHLAWFRVRISSEHPCWIAETSRGTRIALVRFDEEERNIFTISLNVSPAFRGQGLAPLLVGKACQTLRRSRGPCMIHAWIRPENFASIRCFERAAFARSDASIQPDRLLFTRSL